MRFGLLYTNEIKYDDLAWVFVSNKIDAEIIDTGISVDSTSPDDAKVVAEKLKEKGIDIAITMDFCPAISDACLWCGIKYIAWIYDSPQQALYNSQIVNDSNYIFEFDRTEMLEVQRLGGRHVMHLPLATNVLRNSGLVINDEDIKKFGCDVSFIGNMYVDDFYEKIYQAASEPVKKEMDDIIAGACGIWDGNDNLGKKISDVAIEELRALCGVSFEGEFAMDYDRYLTTRLFARRLTYLERCSIAKKLSRYDFRLYTSSKEFTLEGVDVRGSLSYDEELPKAYHLSKINLNITLHSIISGVPLRVFDIMGVGGFMLTNYQPEIDDLFTIGKDIEVFRSEDELLEKVDYYLKHEDKRVKIALNGYRKVSEKFDYAVQFGKMLEFML